jgi:NADPH:quinone reductase
MKALLPTRDPSLVSFGDVDRPEPGAGEALIRVEAFSINRGETFLLEKPPAGWRPGKDIAGLVVQGAADGSGPAAGARVVAHPAAGGWAEYAAVATDSIAELPAGIPAVTAAALPLAGLTALRLLRVAGDVNGRRILLTGASGGVGHYLVELAARAGAEVTAIVSAADRGSRLTDLGARAVLGHVTAAEGPFDLVMESVGGDVFRRALARLAPGGTLIWFGQASREPVTLSFFDVLYHQPSATIRHFSYADPPPYGADLTALVLLVATGRLHPEVGRVADWADTAATLIDLRDRRIRGNAVLTVNSLPIGART